MNVITNNSSRCNIALAALRQVKDPEIGLGVVDLGLIYQIDFDEELRKIYALMTLTTQFCPMGESIVDAVKNALHAAFPGDDMDVSLTFNPRWNATLISAKGKMFLNK
ncbi:metal-sulfur cluster assembly factor [Terrimonas alba]|uniref:metal-sulfur cluster assembly factor n=1 Tax=Terrimonas alba TaxID=3349636 RepID=UPI0035F361BB